MQAVTLKNRLSPYDCIIPVNMIHIVCYSYINLCYIYINNAIMSTLYIDRLLLDVGAVIRNQGVTDVTSEALLHFAEMTRRTR